MAQKSNLPSVPDGAVQIGDDAYQVPIGKDSDGCEQYRMFSRKKAVVAAIFYRDRDGNFTMDKSKADCAGG